MTSQPAARIGIVTVSDRASRGQYEDRGGPAIRECLGEILSCPWEAVARSSLTKARTTAVPDSSGVVT